MPSSVGCNRIDNQGTCTKCKGVTEHYNQRWCDNCWYPDIAEVYAEYRAMLEGHPKLEGSFDYE